MTEKSTLVKAAGLILAISIIGRLLGFVREQVIAAEFGTTMATDAYLMAFTIPNLIYVILGGALATAFIPVFTSTNINQGREEASRLASYIANLAALVMSIIAVLGILSAPILVSLIAPGFSPEAKALTVKLARIMFPCVLLYTLSMLQGGILNSLRHFTMPAFTSAAFSGTVILSVFLLVPEMGVYGLALGTVLAMVVQVLIQVPAMFGRGLRYYPSVSLQHPGVQKIGELVLPVMIGTGVNQIYVTIDRILASTLSEGSLAALNFANKLMFLPFNLFVVAINTAVFPSFSALAAKGDHKGLGDTMVFGLNLVGLFTIPAAVGLFVLSSPIVRVLFERGAFDAQSTQMTAFALQFFIFGLFAQGAYNVINRTYYALHDTKTPVKISIAVVILNLILSLILIRYLQHGGLALSNSLAALVNMFLAYWLLRPRLPDLPEKRLFLNLGKILLASLLMGLGVYLLDILLAARLEMTYFKGQLIHLGACMMFGVALYLVLVVLLRVDEVREFIGRLASRLLGKAGKEGDREQV